MYERRYGSKYHSTQDLDIKDIAKLIRQDIKQAIKDGSLPTGIKVSVKISRFSMGQSIDMRIKEYPGEWIEDVDSTTIHRRYTNSAQAVLKKLKSIHDQYNYDGSEVQVDYFDVHYYGHPSFHWQCKNILELGVK